MSEFYGAIAAVVVGLVGYLGIRSQGRAAHAAARTTSEGPNWSAFTKELKEAHADDLRKVEERLAKAEQKMTVLEERASASERVQVAAVSYVTRLLDWIADQMPGVEHPRIPDDLREHVNRAAGEAQHLPRP